MPEWSGERLEELVAHIERAEGFALAAFWPADATSQAAITVIVATALLMALAIHLPLVVRLARIAGLRCPGAGIAWLGRGRHQPCPDRRAG